MKGKSFKKLVVLGVSAMVVALLAGGVLGCTKGLSEPEVTEWNLPVVTPLTGGFAGFGLEGKWAIEAAVEDINAVGGIAGKPIKVTFYDGSSDPAKSNAAMARALDTNPLMVGLGSAEPGVRGAMPLVVENELIAIGPAMGTIFAREFEPWAVCLMPYDENCCGSADVAWLEREPDIKTVVPIFENTIQWYGNCNKNRVRWLEEAGITVLKPVTFEQAAAVDFGSLAVSALGQEADGYIFTSNGDPVAKTIIEMHRRGMTDNRRISIAVSADYPELYEIGEGYIDGCYMSAFYDINHDTEQWQSIKARYGASRDVPMGFGTSLSYDVPWLFKRAVEATGVTGDPAKLAEERLILAEWAYNQKDYPLVMGPTDIIDGIAMQPIFLCKIEDNQKVLIEVVPSPGVPAAYR